MKLWIDCETYSDTPINWGTYRYTDSVEVMVVTWAAGDGPVQCIDLTQPHDLAELQWMFGEADEVWAHNAMFDRRALQAILPAHLHGPRMWRCTMVQAMAHSMPGSLGKLSEVLGLPSEQAKIKEGRDLVALFCKPRPKNMTLRRATRETHPAEWQRFLEYATRDIDAMREVKRRLPIWNYRAEELALWHLDQEINDRGFAIDLELAEAAIRATDDEQALLADATYTATAGEVGSATQRDAMLEHILAEYGVALPDMTASTLERRITDPNLPPALRELLGIRLQATTSSTAKYRALVNGQTGGRLRGTLQFAGAGRTGRWSGRTFQPQNLPRPERGFDGDAQEIAVAALKSGTAGLIYDNVMRTTANCIRGCIIAPPGRKLVVADLSNIEGRMLAWLAGEEWKLDAFRAFDAGTGPDLYKLAYSATFGVPVDEVSKDQRQIGKVEELAFGYEGGVGAWVTFAAAYGIDLEELARFIVDIPADVLEEARWSLKWTLEKGRPTFGLSEAAWLVCDSFKRLWRRAHPETVALWAGLQEAAVNAVQDMNTTYEYGRFRARRDGAWLRIALPSGRALCYPQPEVDDKGALSYMGINQYSRQWSRLSTYGGKLVENATQAAARDVLAHGMQMADRNGYEIVLTVHDEIISEVPDSPRWSVEDLAGLMSVVPAWAEGLPLAAAGFEANRYRKD